MMKESDGRAAPAPPTPRVDPDSASYWAALREHRVELRACVACSRRRLLPTPTCPYCAHPGFRVETTKGTGIVYSFVTVHRAFDPGFANDVPYAVATIDLDDGARALGRVEGEPFVGAPVTPEFVDHETWTELRFRVSRAR